MGTRRVNIILPNELVKKADLVAKVAHKNRTEVIKEALQEYFEGIEDEADLRKGSPNSTSRIRSSSTP
ncbi:ribbon-helix-helix domain-containing protein [Natronosalvus caseinilyticus]|uniref:ribbon-helix-helix domain-containing protein n=1 Tax=Natronosalvus caseinilyticus TaxID=2953747 RepID=UPI0028B09C21|nr:ribbon-helix-helix domain-containing protein [Natronosalvus caseinilyticus]